MNWYPHVEEVVITHEQRGKGVEGDPIRSILTVWSLEGEKLAEADDPFRPSNHQVSRLRDAQREEA